MGVSENSDGLERLRDSTKPSRLVNIRALYFLSSYSVCNLRAKEWDRAGAGCRERKGRDALEVIRLPSPMTLTPYRSRLSASLCPHQD